MEEFSFFFSIFFFFWKNVSNFDFCNKKNPDNNHVIYLFTIKRQGNKSIKSNRTCVSLLITPDIYKHNLIFFYYYF